MIRSRGSNSNSDGNRCAAGTAAMVAGAMLGATWLGGCVDPGTGAASPGQPRVVQPEKNPEQRATNFGENIQLEEICDPNCLTLVADHDGELIAFAQVRLHSPKELVVAERPAELHRLYVSEQWHGQGTAHQIMSAILEAPTLQKADALWLSVWEHNPRAIAFYRKYGFEVVGDHVFQVGSDPQRDLVMVVEINDRHEA